MYNGQVFISNKSLILNTLCNITGYNIIGYNLIKMKNHRMCKVQNVTV